MECESGNFRIIIIRWGYAAGQLNTALACPSPSLRGGEADEAISSRSPRRFAPRDDKIGAAAWEEWEIPREAAPWQRRRSCTPSRGRRGSRGRRKSKPAKRRVIRAATAGLADRG